MINLIALLGTLGTWEILLIVLIILLVFGGKKLPELARGLGKGVKEFQKAKDDIENSLEEKKSDNGGSEESRI